jgi:serine/threonine protein kinase
LASALPDDAQLQLAVAELLLLQRDYGPALPLLQRALGSPQAGREERLRAHFLLHEAALGTDQEALAETHLLQLLAEDFGYPGARARLARLQARAPVGSPGAGLAAPLGLPGPGGGLLAPAAPTLLGLPSGPEARYQLRRELGCGSAGTVYLAYDTELSCELALKVFYPRRRGGGSDEALLRALHEARLLSAVRHPGVIALYDLVGELPDEAGTSGAGPPRLAMELCRGGSLRARLRLGPLPPRTALRRGVELLDTLAAVHRTGVVHGDLKPENLLFRGPDLHRGDLPPAEARYGDLVLSDFGLARLGAHDREASAGLGTFGYVAPERLGGALADAASDVYAAAAVVVEMLGGELLPTRPGIAPERWSARNAALGPCGPAVADFLAQLLAHDPATRPSAAAAQEQLQALAAALPEPPDA